MGCNFTETASQIIDYAGRGKLTLPKPQDIEWHIERLSE
jgi:hypothetical protein